MSFKKKQLTQTKRVCLRLKELRESKQLTLYKLSRKTKLDEKYLKAVEECRFEDLPKGSIYKKNFIKSYVKALGLDPEPFLQQFTEEEVVIEKKTKHPRTTIRYNPLSHLPSILKFISFAAVLTILVIYLGSQIKNIIEPPELQIYFPEDGYITNESSITVHGKTEEEVRVSVNGRGISNNKKGEFKEGLNLTPGVNTLVISAEKKHGKITNQTIYVTLQDTGLVN